MTRIFSLIISGFFLDCKLKKITTACVRALRSTRYFFEPNLVKKLMGNQAYQRHLDFIDKNDSLFFLSYKYYLVKGLTSCERIQTALFHYEYETNCFDDKYFNSVYKEKGLILWTSSFNETVFDIRLLPGNDVYYEGGCSIVLHVNGERVCVISYSMVPTDVFLPNTNILNNNHHASKASIFVTRKHLNRDYSYQNEYNKAFDRVMPAQMCMSALAAIGLSQGFDSFLGIAFEVHTALKPESINAFDAAYNQFWISLNGKKTPPYGYVTELPLYNKPLDEMDAKAKKRALTRRKHLQEVYDQAHQIMLKHVLQRNKILIIWLTIFLNRSILDIALI